LSCRDNGTIQIKIILMPEEIQHYLFNQIRQKVAPEISLPKEIEAALGVSPSNAYKKIRGDVPLSAEELILLAKRYDVSLDTCIHRQTGRFAFKYSALDRPVRSPTDYAASVVEHTEAVLRLPDPAIWYATYEVPLFYWAFFPALFAFKLYIWARVNWQLPAEQHNTFDPARFLAEYPELSALATRISVAYTAIPSREFWPVQLLDHTISQLRTCAHAGLLADKGVAVLLYEEMGKMIDHLQSMAENCHKIDPGTGQAGATAELYFNEIAYTNNTVLIRAGGKTLVAYAALDNPNFIRMEDPPVVDQLERWLESIRQRTIKISGEGERFRHYLFQQMRRRLGDLKNELATF
jgi:hypothetical protein